MIPGNFTTTAIITKGLHNGPACQGIITTRFSLYCKEVVVTPPPGGGGPYPGSAWNKFDSAKDIYTPVDQEVIIPWEEFPDPLRKHTLVTLKINIGSIHVEKIYKVADKRRGAVVKIFNMLDVTQSRLSATISGLKRIAVRAKAFITNLKLK